MAVVPLNWATPARVLLSRRLPTRQSTPTDTIRTGTVFHVLIPMGFEADRGKDEGLAKQGANIAGGAREGGAAASVRREIPSSPRESLSWSKKDDAARRGAARLGGEVIYKWSFLGSSKARQQHAAAKLWRGAKRQKQDGASRRGRKLGCWQPEGRRGPCLVKDRGERENRGERERERDGHVKGHGKRAEGGKERRTGRKISL